MQNELDFVTNRDLFSNYYLKEHLPETDDWEVEDRSGLEDAFDRINSLYEDGRGGFENQNESQLEKNFIRPVFEALGHVYEVEETVERGRRRPDYAVFETDEVRRGAIQGKDEGRDFYRNALSVADAKQWNLSLDKLSASGEKKTRLLEPEPPDTRLPTGNAGRLGGADEREALAYLLLGDESQARFVLRHRPRGGSGGRRR